MMNLAVFWRIGLLLSISLLVFYNMNYYWVKGHFKSITLYSLAWLPLIFLGNIVVMYAYKWAAQQNTPIWHIQILYWGMQVVFMLILTYLWFGELPNLRTGIGTVLVLAGVYLAIGK